MEDFAAPFEYLGHPGVLRLLLTSCMLWLSISSAMGGELVACHWLLFPEYSVSEYCFLGGNKLELTAEGKLQSMTTGTTVGVSGEPGL